MSAFYFCSACGNNLTYISNRRLKCYKCGKYFTENFICRCQRNRALKYSAEIIAPNKVKCFFCGQEAQVPANLEPPFIDKYRGSAGSGSLSSWDGQVNSFQQSVRRSKSVKRPKQKVTEIEKPEIDYVSEDGCQIIIRFPGHNNPNQIRCEIVDGVLEVQSRLVDFWKKFPLPNSSTNLKTELRNAVLDICLEGKPKTSEQ